MYVRHKRSGPLWCSIAALLLVVSVLGISYATTTVQEDVRHQGQVTFLGGIGNTWSRSQLTQESFARYALEPETWKVHDAPQTNLPGTAATDDLAILGGTFGTNVPYLASSDAAMTSVTQRGRRTSVLPPEYVAGQSVRIIAAVDMEIISDTSATLDVEVYLDNGDGTKTGSDLVTTAATTINSATAQEVTFDLTATSLSPGDRLDIRITVAITDSATGSGVVARIGSLWLACDIKG